MKSMRNIFEMAKGVAKTIEKDTGMKISVGLENEGREDEMVLVDGWIDIARCEIETETIAETRRHPGFVVEVAKTVHNYPSEPDDVDIVEVDRFGNAWDAVKEAFSLWFENYLDLVIDNADIRGMLSAFQKEEEVM